MALHRRAAKRDANEPAIVSALEALGCIVWRVSGKGLPDLIVLHHKGRYFADVKGQKEKPTSAQETAWGEAATKARCLVFILRTPEDAQKMLNNALQPWEPTPTIVMRQPRLKGSGVKLTTRRVREMKAGYVPPQELVDGRPHFNGKVAKSTRDAARKGDAAKAREEGRKRLAAATHAEAEAMKGGPLRVRCAKNGCRRMLPCATHPVHPVLMGPMPGYTPPRSKPVAHRADCEQVYHKDNREPCTCGALDTAKEAEATFAPAMLVCSYPGCDGRAYVRGGTCGPHARY